MVVNFVMRLAAYSEPMSCVVQSAVPASPAVVDVFRGRGVERLAFVFEAVLLEVDLAIRVSFKIGFTELRIFS
jgi:hypothetical protein